jgi:hypothetical protein
MHVGAAAGVCAVEAAELRMTIAAAAAAIQVARLDRLIGSLHESRVYGLTD